MNKEEKELYYKLMTDCGALIEECPNEKAGKRVLACEYCRFEYARKSMLKNALKALYDEFASSGENWGCARIKGFALRQGINLGD